MGLIDRFPAAEAIARRYHDVAASETSRAAFEQELRQLFPEQTIRVLVTLRQEGAPGFEITVEELSWNVRATDRHIGEWVTIDGKSGFAGKAWRPTDDASAGPFVDLVDPSGERFTRLPVPQNWFDE
jgi:hypothetical protein